MSTSYVTYDPSAEDIQMMNDFEKILKYKINKFKENKEDYLLEKRFLGIPFLSEKYYDEDKIVNEFNILGLDSFINSWDAWDYKYNYTNVSYSKFGCEAIDITELFKIGNTCFLMPRSSKVLLKIKDLKSSGKLDELLKETI